MTSVHGAIAPFDPDTDKRTEYIKHLQFYFTTNNIRDGPKQKAILLSNCGASTFRILRSIVLPDALMDVTFTTLVNKMKEHWEPKSSVIVQCFQFNSRQRASNETVAEYMAALRKLAEHCNYGHSLNEMLGDRLVCRIANPTIQKRLLAEPDLTLDKAVSMAQAAELADKGAKELQAGDDKSLKDVHKVSSSSQQRGSHSKDTPPRDKSIGNCYRCGGKHSQLTCHFKSETCHFCDKKGHCDILNIM
ncbi:uncharacterized protein [Dysidea avara]|uniref:uncharacterized protein n=1 Tax=Dysidea avara TaxID=196820 RepID=UPI00332D63C1